MAITNEIIYGNSINNETNLPMFASPLVTIKGTSGASKASFGIDESILSKHTLLVGGTGSGKTNLAYHYVNQLKNKMTKDDIMIIFDSKGDFYKKFYNQGLDIVIGNSKQFRNKSAIWNICKEIIADGTDAISINQNAQEISKSIFADRVEKNSNNPFFPNAARDLFASVMISIIRDKSGFNNRDLRNYMDISTIDDIRDLISKYRDLVAVESYIGGKSGAQAQGVMSEMYSTARDVLTGVFADAGSFSIRNFVRAKGGKTLFLEYDMAIGDVLSPIYTLLFDLALKEALGSTSSQGNVYLIADELKLLPNLRHLEDGINFGRSLGVKILAGLQSIDQLNANYDNEARARNMIAGFSSVFAFKANDYTTREYISNLFGKNLIFQKYPLASGEYHNEIHEGHTVEDWDLINLQVGEAVVGLPGYPPFRFKFELY